MIKYGQPGTHAIRQSADVLRIDFMAVQFTDNVLAHGVVIYQTYKGRLQFHIRDILRYISGHSAVILYDNSGITPGGDVRGCGISLQIHKYSTDHCNSHLLFLTFPLFIFRDLNIPLNSDSHKTLTDLL